MTQKDQMLQSVLDNEHLMSSYHYGQEDIADINVYDAQSSKNAIIAGVARIIKELNGSTDASVQKQVYKKLFNHLNNYLVV